MKTMSSVGMHSTDAERFSFPVYGVIGIRQIDRISFGNLARFQLATWQMKPIRIVRLNNVRRHVHSVGEIGLDAEVMGAVSVHVLCEGPQPQLHLSGLYSDCPQDEYLILSLYMLYYLCTSPITLS